MAGMLQVRDRPPQREADTGNRVRYPPSKSIRDIFSIALKTIWHRGNYGMENLQRKAMEVKGGLGKGVKAPFP